MVKFHGFLYEIWVRVLGIFLGEICVIDECGMKWDEMRANWKDKWKGKGEP
jgi:hypothetical protein